MSFTDEEHRCGQNFLRTLGIPQGAEFICFSARDNTYLDMTQTHKSRDELSYHDYRDCDINAYLPAAEQLAAQGIWALRMGAAVKQPISSVNPHVIDYASKFRTDFADAYLMAHCKFFIGCTAGNFLLSSAFRVPCALANMTPLGHVARSARDLFIPKTYRSAKKSRPLRFRDVIALGADLWLSAKQFELAEIEVIENSSEDILELAMEMDARLKGTWQTQFEDDELQARFRSLFPVGHQNTGYPSRVGADFLRKHAHLLD